jgi:hypothetical protein
MVFIKRQSDVTKERAPTKNLRKLRPQTHRLANILHDLLNILTNTLVLSHLDRVFLFESDSKRFSLEPDLCKLGHDDNITPSEIFGVLNGNSHDHVESRVSLR